MSDIQLANQTTPAAPGSAQSVLYVESTGHEVMHADNAIFKVLRTVTNANTADVTANAADTYLTGSALTPPTTLVKIGTTMCWLFAMSKTAAGVAQPVWSLRVGTAGTLADAARLTFTGSAQTAVGDNGIAQVWLLIRSIGATGVAAGVQTLTHVGNTAGLASIPTDVQQVTSAGFDMTVAGTKYGVSCNPGAAGVWTFQLISAMYLHG